MRSIILKSGVLGLAFLGVFAGSAHASDTFVKVPFQFVVGRQTMPAGEYVINRLDIDPSVMVIRNKNLHDKSMAIVMGEQASGVDPAGNKPALTFTHDDEGEYRLSTVWESRSIGEDVWSN